jgi:hypothetical protein
MPRPVKMDGMKVVLGILPGRYVMSKWDEDRFVSCLSFLKHFVVPSKFPGKDAWNFDAEKIALVINDARVNDTNGWKEWVYRTGVLEVSSGTTQNFARKVQMISRAVGGYLKHNPSLVTGRIEEIVKSSSKFSWIIQLTQDKKASTGADMVGEHTMTPTVVQGALTPVPNPATPERRYHEAIMRVTDLFYQIASSVNVHNVKKYKEADKINMLSKLSFILKVAKNHRPNKVFQQINVYKAGREDLEKSMLTWASENENASVEDSD